MAQDRKSARQVRERLHISLRREHTHGDAAGPDCLPELQRELLDVIAKYTHVLPQSVQVQRQREEGVDVLELNIELLDDGGERGAS